MGFEFVGELPFFGPNDTITPVDEIQLGREQGAGGMRVGRAPNDA